MEKCIKVWHFEDAPEEFRNLSKAGGEEAWLVFIPAEMAGDWLPWQCINNTSYLVERHELPDGSEVVIGSS